ncbi:MAG: cysteinyl-tRNA synthetase [Acidimicrobiaceae bacterium]|nr:cysteinyl-tRNA synthetase [Acidimicrobiaceae bacterium]
MLRLHDTATGRLEDLEGHAFGLYVCGPTVYGPPHTGHGRTVLVFDVLRRWLEQTGAAVRHVANVTDVDDKIIDRAAREGRPADMVASEAEAQWWDAMDRLGCLRPHDAPHATGWVEEMVELVSALLAQRAAYATSDGVYLDTTAVPDYGLLKHQDLEDLRAGARIAVGEEKRSPFDFALWKAAKPGEPVWEAPFGPGRPGWHTECVAMSLGLLGEGFELHGGGSDLIFPHHENERAQAVALGRRFARHWVHSGLVTVGGEKMSKSLGNFTTLEELFAVADPRAYRLLVLQAHYRSPLEVRPDLLEDAGRTLGRIDALHRRITEAQRARGRPTVATEEASDLDKAVRAAMDEDLDTPQAVASAFSAMRRTNAYFDRGDTEGAVALGLAALAALGALGLEAAGESVAEPGALELAKQRDQARAARDYTASDRIRAELEALGWRVEDTPDGTRLRR